MLQAMVMKDVEPSARLPRPRLQLSRPRLRSIALRNAHALDSHARYLVELLPSAAKTAVRRARIRAERSPAYLATVTPSATRLGGKPAVATDGDAALSKVLALWLGACLVLDGLHRSSVPGLKTRCFTNDLKYLRVTDQQRIPQAPVSKRVSLDPIPRVHVGPR